MLAGPPVAQAASAMVPAPAGRLDARCGAVLDRTGSEDFQGRQPPHQTLQILGMADPGSPAPPSRCHLPSRSLYAAQTDEGPRQAWLHAILHLFYLADAEVGAGAVSDRTHRLSCPGICKAASPGCSNPASRLPPRCQPPMASTTDSSFWNTIQLRAARNTSIPKNTRSRCGTGTSRATSSPTSAISTARAGKTRRC